MAKSADAFRTISEVADWLGVQTHVLRFWESKFTQVKPVKRAGGRRYYRPADMLLLGGIRKLLHDDGLTIKGVQKILREEGIAHVADLSPPLDDDTAAQLDADLVSKPDAEGEAAPAPPPPPIAQSLDHAPEHSRPDTPSEASTPTEQGEDAAADLPSFMRGPEPAPDPNAEITPRAPDVPTLTPDMGDFDAETDRPAAQTTDEASPSPETYAPISEDVPATPPDVPVASFAPDEVQEPEAFDPEPPLVEDSPPHPVSEPEHPAEPLSQAPAEPPQSDPIPDAAPMFTHTRPEATPEPAAPPRPRIVDVPDDEGIVAADFSPTLLTRATTLRRLTPAQADALRPLVAQLTALRDQMARARQDPR
ncbi:MAG: MerR family transcriptional regulator [Pseudomonadota bacterium]